MAMKNFFLSVISFFLMILILVSIILSGVNTLLYPNIYLNVFEKNNVYDTIISDQNISAVSPFIKIPKEGIRSLVEPLISNFLSYMRGSTDNVSLKVEIDSDAIRQFFEKSAKDFPVCSNGESSYDANGDPVCRPPEKNSTEFLYEVLEKKNVTIIQGGTVDLADVYGLKSEDLSKLRDNIATYRHVYYGILALSIFLILLAILISRNSLSSGFKWVGADLFIPGLFSLVVGFIGFDLIVKYLPLQDIGSGLLERLAEDFIAGILSRIKIYGAIVLAAGIGFFAGSFFMKNKEMK